MNHLKTFILNILVNPKKKKNPSVFFGDKHKIDFGEIQNIFGKFKGIKIK